MAIGEQLLMTSEDFIDLDKVTIITDLNTGADSELTDVLFTISKTFNINVHNVQHYMPLFNNELLDITGLWLNWELEKNLWQQHDRFIILFEFFDFSKSTLIQTYMQQVAEYFSKSGLLNQKEIYCVILTKNTDIHYQAHLDIKDQQRLWSVKPFQKWASNVNALYLYPSVVVKGEGNISEQLQEAIIASLLKKQKIIIRKKHKYFYIEKISHE